MSVYYYLIIRLLQAIALLTGVSIIAAAVVDSCYAQETTIRASFLSAGKEPIPVNILTGQSCLVIFDQPIGRLAVSNTDTAEAVLVAPNQMMVNGKASGRARFTTWAKEGDKFLFFDVDVRVNLAQIDSQVRALFPKEDIRLSQANGSVVISGNVEPKVGAQVESVVQAAGFKTVNLLVQPVQSATQVQLQLRLAEVSRNKLSELAATPAIQVGPGQGGYANTGAGPYSLSRVEEGSIFGTVANTLNLFLMTNNTHMFLRALQQQGALRALAEPNLTAMNGQQASFLAGGELPIPIFQGGGGASGNSVTIQFKEYGVRVTFKPTILDEDHIRLEIEPEVSTLDYQNAIRFNGFLIPALRTRRAKTGVELRDGQSFGIAGLIDNNESRSLAKIPVISSVPILGNLFKSKAFQKNETELVFIVTAKITEPLNPDSIPNMKGIDGLKGSSPLGVESPGAGGTSGGTGSGSTSGGAASFVTSGANGSAAVPGKGGAASAPAGDTAPTPAPAPASAPGSVTGSGNDDEPASGDAPAQKPAPATPPVVPALPAPPPVRIVSKHTVEQMGWKIRTPQRPEIVAE
ncbi:MAG: type II and III secretion system protein family protein, partial [Blastocatellia bacterium]